MGNGSSQSIVLGSPRPLGVPLREGRYQRGVPQYAHPHNRVLPKPVAGQRLRSTDNGNILHSAGTIRGQKPGGTCEPDTGDSEMMDILRKRSEIVDKEEECYHQLNLRNHRLFHSDPDIARTRPIEDYSPMESVDSGAQRRSCGGAATRASKLKYRKKAKAPAPPDPTSLPRQFERRQQSSSEMGHGNQRKVHCRCLNGGPKTRAPAPPAILVHPPPPPPLPAVTTRTATGQSPISEHPRTPVTTRTTEWSPSKNAGYEKNVHPLDKWRLSRSAGDVRIDEGIESRPDSRTTVYDSKAKQPEVQVKKPVLIPHQPDPFQREIEAVTKKIAENRQQVPIAVTTTGEEKESAIHPPKQYYFSDPDAFRKIQTSVNTNSASKEALIKTDNIQRHHQTCDVSVSVQEKDLTSNDILMQRGDKTNGFNDRPSLERFSPNRRRLKSPNRSSSPSSVEHRSNKDWGERHTELFQRLDEESDIDIRLRPVLPRKTLDIPKFSPSEAWQALGSDGLGSSNHSTSEGDETQEFIRRYNLPNAHLRNKFSDRCVSDIGRTRYDNFSPIERFKNRSLSDSHWTPRQDLADDSDASSVDSEDAVIPKNHLGEISTRFSLPTVMFSNMRPIGSELSSTKLISSKHPIHFDEVPPRFKQSKRKIIKNINPPADVNAVSNIKRFLGMRNKYLSEEDVSVSDSNWTFGKHGLQQKKGKQYASDLMLSDKKKYELIVKNNFGEFLGDILVTKANDMRNKMRSSDSGNSNFSFYSTEGHVVYLPESDNYLNESYAGGEASPPTKGRVYDARRKFEANSKAFQTESPSKNHKKKFNIADREIEKKRGLELVRMLEDEVRRRRSKEKLSIRQQLQMMKHLESNDEEEVDDEAYFTEPKSREGTSPLHVPQSDIGLLHGVSSRLQRNPSEDCLPNRSAASPTPAPLTHWMSSPALFQDNAGKQQRYPKGYRSSSSVMSSPDQDSWQQPTIVDRWIQGQQQSHLQGQRTEKLRKVVEDNCSMGLDGEKSSSDDYKFPPIKETSKSSLPQVPQRKEKRKTNIYKQLMDIVRKEERQLSKAQGSDYDPASRDSSYSQRQSSHSTSSPDTDSSSSSYSYSDSSDHRTQDLGKSGIPANNEFHTSTCRDSKSRQDLQPPKDRPKNAPPPFQVAFVQPFTPNKGYRHVPFEVPAASTACRMPGLQEEGHQVQTQVS